MADSGDQPTDAALADAAPPVPWYDPAWLVRRRLVIQSAQVQAPGNGALTHYPALIDLTGEGLQARADGFDVLFTAADGLQKLPHEIERWDQAGDHLVAWVAVDSLSSTEDTVLYLYSDNANAPDQADVTRVWDDNHRGVWHLNQDPGSGTLATIRDSSPHGRHMTAVLLESGDLKPGRIGLGIEYGGDNEYTETRQNINISGDSAFTMEAWVLPGDNSTPDAYGKGISAWGFAGSTSRASFLYYDSDDNVFEVGFWANDDQTAGDYQQDTWYHVVNTYDGATQNVYVNGQMALSRAPGPLNLFDDWYRVGVDSFGQARFFVGMIDEARVSNIARSAEWIATTYNNHSAPASFVVVGAAEAAP